ncbi:MAG: SDR family NAD(P)-dependent oxidoreductase [Chloroflexi bacterium]|nr:SDR family NAD(P)-dependent oxidoreductase [Chloroflexota bacterium]
MPKWTVEEDMPDQTGRLVIVTGANSGLGYETTLALAKKNATVLMACRNLDKAETARQQIIDQVPGADLRIMKLDLGSLESVHTFAEEVRQGYTHIDILYNNAGVMAIPRRETADGFEMQFGVNHLGHFALTGLLLDCLIDVPESRIVTVTSFASYNGRIDFDDLHGEQRYTRYGAYSQTKVANLLFGLELHRRLREAEAQTASIVAHPGYAHTDLQSTSTSASGNLVERITYGILNNVLAQSAQMGALPQLYAATDPDAESGKLYGPHLRIRGYPSEERPVKYARSEDVARRLWEVSEELTGVRYAFAVPA